MAKRQFKLAEKQIQELITAYDRCKDGPTRTRYQAVRLYGTGYAESEVEAITGCSRSTLMGWCRIYRAQGIVGLVDKRQGGNRAKLTSAQIEELAHKLKQYTPDQAFRAQGFTSEYWSVESLRCAVQEWYGVTYQSRTSYYTLFDACGFSCQQPAKAYKSRSEAKVAAFEEQLEKK
jgi:putative transposase